MDLYWKNRSKLETHPENGYLVFKISFSKLGQYIGEYIGKIIEKTDLSITYEDINEQIYTISFNDYHKYLFIPPDNIIAKDIYESKLNNFVKIGYRVLNKNHKQIGFVENKTKNSIVISLRGKQKITIPFSEKNKYIFSPILINIGDTVFEDGRSIGIVNNIGNKVIIVSNGENTETRIPIIDVNKYKFRKVPKNNSENFKYF